MKYLVLQGRLVYGRDGGVLGYPGQVIDDADPNFPASVSVGNDVVCAPDAAPAATEQVDEPTRAPVRDFRIGGMHKGRAVNGEDLQD